MAFDPIPKAVRAEVLARDGMKCTLCGRRVYTYAELQAMPEAQRDHRLRLSLDHIIPVVKGGAHTPDNLRVTCVTCNSRRGAAKPYSVPIGQDEALEIVSREIDTPSLEISGASMRIPIALGLDGDLYAVGLVYLYPAHAVLLGVSSDPTCVDRLTSAARNISVATGRRAPLQSNVKEMTD